MSSIAYGVLYLVKSGEPTGTLSIENYNGTYIEFFFTPTNCPACNLMISYLEAISKNYKVPIILRCISNTDEDKKICIENFGLENYESAIKRRDSLNVTTIPTLVVNGTNKFEGYMDYKEIESLLKR